MKIFMTRSCMALVLAMAVFAMQSAIAGPQCKEKMHEHMKEALGLSEEQIETVHALKVEKREAMKGAREVRKNIRELIKAGDADAAAELAAEQARKKVHAKAQFHSKLKEVLSAEQIEKFEAMHKKHRQHGKGYKGKGHHGEGSGKKKMCGDKDSNSTAL